MVSHVGEAFWEVFQTGVVSEISAIVLVFRPVVLQKWETAQGINFTCNSNVWSNNHWVYFRWRKGLFITNKESFLYIHITSESFQFIMEVPLRGLKTVQKISHKELVSINYDLKFLESSCNEIEWSWNRKLTK